ncbi:hypothetical protein [Marinobacter gelidimuriae]|uniref:hypothetical protein n=1 Tax=Marinobacter gelidimuriae TaxID=2739064 RepID=UPI00389931FB
MTFAVAARNDGKALADLLVQLQQADPQFRLQDAELSVTMAGALYRSGHYRLALKLLLGASAGTPAITRPQSQL